MTGTIHATAVAIRGQGVLLLGPPGSGKSDLALRLIDRGAQLIADDRVAVGEGALLSVPSSIAGRLEVRGLGIISLPFVEGVPAALAVRLDAVPERMPEPMQFPLGNIAVPLIHLAPFESSAPIKVELAVADVLGLARAGTNG